MYFIFEENGPESTFETYNIKHSVSLNPLIQHLETQLEISCCVAELHTK